jgi:hypothetical protein
MSLQKWAEYGWLRSHATSPQEISDLLAIADRDITDSSSGGISTDWQFGIAYNAALKLCTILLYAEGYRAGQGLQHYRTIQALPLILGSERNGDASYLDACRVKRNTVEYDRIGATSDGEVAELLEFVLELHADVLKWMKLKHPELLPLQKR